MSERRPDPWETWDEQLPPVAPEPQAAPAPGTARRRWPAVLLIGALALCLSVAVVLWQPPSGQEPEQSASSVAAELRRGQEQARLAYIRRYVKLALRGRSVNCSKLPTLPGQELVAKSDAASNAEIVGDLNLLRRAQGRKPLPTDPLLEDNATTTAEQLAADPELITSFASQQSGRHGLVVDGLASGKWSHIDEDALTGAPGATAEVGACEIAGDPTRVQLIRDALYVGVGSARITAGEKVWVIEYGNR